MLLAPAGSFHAAAASYRPPPDATLVSDVDDNRPVRLLAVLRPLNQFRAEAAELSTGSQLMARYRSDPDVLDRLFRFAAEYGLTVGQADTTRNTVVLTGSYGQARRAFQPDHLGLYRKGKREFVGRSGHLHLPTYLVDDVVAVMGFDGRTIPVRRLHPMPAGAAADGAYEPVEAASLYGFPSGLDGKGETIGIIALGGGYDEACLRDYFAKKGIRRTGGLTAVSVDGTPNDPSMGDDSDFNDRVREVHADIEIIGSIAPAANIVVYFASYRDIRGLHEALLSAVTDSVNAPSVVSVSWHYPEDIASDGARGQLDSINQTLEMAKTGNITVCVASGDYGANEDQDRPAEPVVSVPASCPFALACGGTIRPRNGVEEGWGQSGGGFSSYFNRPSYQDGALAADMKRGVPDVSAIADPGYVFFVNGSDFACGGTSVSAPLWASLIALLNQKIGRPLGFINPDIYKNPGCLTDITSGGNSQFQAKAGWDPVTGLGSPRGTNLAELFKP